MIIKRSITTMLTLASTIYCTSSLPIYASGTADTTENQREQARQNVDKIYELVNLIREYRKIVILPNSKKNHDALFAGLREAQENLRAVLEKQPDHKGLRFVEDALI